MGNETTLMFPLKQPVSSPGFWICTTASIKPWILDLH